MPNLNRFPEEEHTHTFAHIFLFYDLYVNLGKYKKKTSLILFFIFLGLWNAFVLGTKRGWRTKAALCISNCIGW